MHTCLDKDSSFVLDQLNSSTNSALSDNPQLQEEIELLDSGSNGVLGEFGLLPRHEGKEYQIAMILLQSYRYVAFSPEVTKIKVCNALRIFAKRFEKELLGYLDQVVMSEIEHIKEKEKEEGEVKEGEDKEGEGVVAEKAEGEGVKVVEKKNSEEN